MTAESVSNNGSDGALIERARKRDPHAWADIYELFSNQLYGFFLRELREKASAEDLTAGVFVEALESVHRFSGNLNDLRSWLFSIGRHNLLDHFRRNRRAVMTPIDSVDPADLQTGSQVADPEERALSNLERDKVLWAIERLSPDQREVILLRLNGNLTSTEIARVIGKTPGAVKALQHRAMGSLAKSLRVEPLLSGGTDG